MTVAAAPEAMKDTITPPLQVGVHEAGEKMAVTPFGRPVVAEKETDAGVPLTKETANVDVPLVAPWTTVKLAGEGAPRLKSNGTTAAVTVKDMVVV